MFTPRVTSVALLAVAIFLSPRLKAISISQFDNMDSQKSVAYVADLVEAGEQSLIDAGRADDARKVSDIFSKSKLGAEQFYMTLAIARNAPNGPRVKVEKVLAVSLEKNNGIKVPQEFFTKAGALDSKYAVSPKR